MIHLLFAAVDQKETYWTLLRNAPHWEFEFTVEVVTAIPSFLIGQYVVKRHDRKKHHEKE
jgi:hypothetical protein